MGISGAAYARGWTTDHALVNGAVNVTNSQKNSSWVPVAVMMRFDEDTSGSMKVIRERNGRRYTLGVCVFADAVSVVWVPDVPYSFGLGDTLRIECSELSGTVEVIRKGE
jgi:hypothetical protein